MIENLRKIIKRNFKKQGRNITTGTVVAFLLSCSTVMATEYGTQIEFTSSNDIKVTIDGQEGNQPDGDKWESLTYTQNGTISKSVEVNGNKITVDGNSASGTIEGVYGLKLTNTSTSSAEITFIQNGTIAISYTETEIKHAGDSETDITRTDKGNGLVIADDGITVDVNGNIKGEIELYGADDVGKSSNVKYALAYANATASANGIYTTNSTSTIGNITGSINGSAILTGGNNTTANHSDGNANASSSDAAATAKSTATANATANGIYMESSQSNTISNITGSINGFAVLTGGDGVTATATANANPNLEDGGRANASITVNAFATATATANGIYMKSSQSQSAIENITGSINGFAILTGGNNTTANSSARALTATATANADSSADATATANGIYMESSQSQGTITIGNIVGSINGFVILTGGNGVAADATATGSVTATGSATANADSSADATATANGIYMKNSQSQGTITIGNIVGSINGFAILTGGNDVTATTVTGGDFFTPVTATADSSATANATANGIYMKSSQNQGTITIGNIVGSINGFAILTGGNGVTATAIGSRATSTVKSTATANATANGIYMESSQSNTISNITGSINGLAILTGGNNASAISNSDSTVSSTAFTSASANGIYLKSSESTIENITGSINGFAILQRGGFGSTTQVQTKDFSIQANASANGIYFNKSTDINNSGKIQGYAGFYNNDGSLIEDLSNSGNPGTVKDVLNFSGNGIAIGTAYNDKLDNKGVIAGSNSAVALSLGSTGAINNYGIMAGKNILGNDDGTTFANSSKLNNCGLTLTLETEKKDNTYSLKVIGIQQGSGTNQSGYTIENANISGVTTNSIKLSNPEYDKYIFNGKNNTVSIASGVESDITNSVINAFETAVSMEGGNLTLNGTVINGGADISYTYDKDAQNPEDKLTMNPSSPAVKFTQDNNQFSAYGSTVINGDIEVDSKGNEITLGLYSQLNGDIIGKGADDDTDLHLGTVTQKESGNIQTGDTLNIQHNITNINRIDIDNSVTFYENISVTGNKLTIAEDGVLNLRLAKGEETKTIGGDQIQVAEHALDGFGGQLIGYGDGTTSDNVGTLKLITQGIGKEIFVPFGQDDYKADDNIQNIKIEASTILDTATTVDNGIYIEAGDDLNKIVINRDNIPDPDLYYKGTNRYEQLDKIYRSIYSSDEINLNVLREILALTGGDGGKYTDEVTDEEQLKNLMNYLNGVYSHSPYAFSSELSRKSVGMFRDIVTDNSFIPNYKKWLVMGGLTHQDAGTTDTYYGKNYHGFDTGTADVDADSKLTGAYVLAKYGYSDKVTLGITAGGNKGDTELSTDSKVKDNAGYVGGFVENYRGNLTLKAGAGVQYSEFDADRKTVSDSYSDKYSDMTYDIYGSLRYSLPLDNNFFLEPYGVLSYTHIDQEGADEGNKALAIETDDKDFNYTTLKTGVDLKKVIPTEKAKHTLTAGVSYERFLDGDDEEYITGRMKGGTDFDILVAHKNKHQISLNAKYEVERQDGILFNVKGEYSFERDSHNNGAKNKTEGEWTVGASIGYKF